MTIESKREPVKNRVEGRGKDWRIGGVERTTRGVVRGGGRLGFTTLGAERGAGGLELVEGCVGTMSNTFVEG